jgi:hypothetical protein
LLLQKFQGVIPMIVITNSNISEERITEIVAHIERAGVQAHVSRGTDRTVIGIIGQAAPTLAEHLRQMKGVENVIKISKSYKLASRDFHPDDTVIDIKGVKIGGNNLVIMGGPCAVETPEQIDEIARLVKAAGGQVLRGGAFKPYRALQLPRSRCGRSRHDGGSRQEARASDDYGGHDAGVCGRLRGICRHPSSRYTQHAEL